MDSQTPGTTPGIDQRIRDALERVADEEAAKSTRVPIVVPVKQISEAMYRIFSGVARIPSYAHARAVEKVYATRLDYSPSEVPPDPDEFQVLAELAGDSPTVVLYDTGRKRAHEFEIETAEELFLAGLAAVAAARARRDEVFAARQAPGDDEQPPREVVQAMFATGSRE